MVETKSAKKQVPFPGTRIRIPEEPGAKHYLVGTECFDCGRQNMMDSVLLSKEGKLWVL